MITKTKKRAHIKPILKSLHWLPIKYRIIFKVLLLVFKSFQGNAPEYILDMLPSYTPLRHLRSAGSNLLIRQMKKTKKNYGHNFSYFAQKHWNRLPVNIRLAQTLDSFKGALKTHLFTNACIKYYWRTSTFHLTQYSAALHPFTYRHTDNWYSHPISYIYLSFLLILSCVSLSH